jgi:hypothetical protein
LTFVDSTSAVLSSAGTAQFNFSNALDGTPYWLEVTHRNALETYSATTQSFTSGMLTYNFSNALTKAYGSNMTLKGGKYCFYSGDVSQDGTIDLTDLISIDNDNSNFVTGYTTTDCNGDSTVDLSDLIIVDNNNSAFISKIIPPGAPAGNSAK